MFCGLPHEEEGQGVTGEVEEALPIPGGIGLGVRDEGRGREVRRMARSRSSPAGAWRCLCCMPPAASVVGMALPSRGVEDAGVFEQAYGRVVLLGEPISKGLRLRGRSSVR